MMNLTRVPARTMRYPYPCFWNRSAHCDLALYTMDDGQNVIICTDPPDNCHTPVSMVIELLIPEVVQHFQIKPTSVVWVQHQPAGKFHSENYELVEFKWGDQGREIHPVSWRALNYQDWRELGLIASENL